MRLSFLPILNYDVDLNPGTGGVKIHADPTTLENGNVVSAKQTEVSKVAYGDAGVTRHVSTKYPLPITTATKDTYRASTTGAGLVTVTTANAIFFVISGSATKTIKVQGIRISGVTLTAVAYLNLNCAKYSTAPTAGTAVTMTKVPLDSTTPAATAALVQGYTAAPTAGTKVGDIDVVRFLAQATTAAAAGIPGEVWFNFSDNKDGGAVVLRGTAECIGLYWAAAPASAPTLHVRVDWTEES